MVVFALVLLVRHTIIQSVRLILVLIVLLSIMSDYKKSLINVVCFILSFKMITEQKLFKMQFLYSLKLNIFGG